MRPTTDTLHPRTLLAFVALAALLALACGGDDDSGDVAGDDQAIDDQTIDDTGGDSGDGEADGSSDGAATSCFPMQSVPDGFSFATSGGSARNCSMGRDDPEVGLINGVTGTIGFPEYRSEGEPNGDPERVAEDLEDHREQMQEAQREVDTADPFGAISYPAAIETIDEEIGSGVLLGYFTVELPRPDTSTIPNSAELDVANDSYIVWYDTENGYAVELSPELPYDLSDELVNEGFERCNDYVELPDPNNPESADNAEYHDCLEIMRSMFDDVHQVARQLFEGDGPGLPWPDWDVDED